MLGVPGVLGHGAGREAVRGEEREKVVVQVTRPSRAVSGVNYYEEEVGNKTTANCSHKRARGILEGPRVCVDESECSECASAASSASSGMRLGDNRTASP